MPDSLNSSHSNAPEGRKVMWTILACPICGLERPYECEHIQSGRSEYRVVEVVPAEVLKTMVAVNEIERDRLRDTIKRVLALTSTFDKEHHGRDVYLVGNLQAREMLQRALDAAT